MRYDSKTGKINIDLSEFVKISRRKISPTPVYDEDEVSTGALAKRFLNSVIGEAESREFSLEFSRGGYDFVLFARADSVDKNTVTVAREISSSPESPSSREMSEIRGEGFIIAYILASQLPLTELQLRFILANRESGEYAEKTETVSKRRLVEFFEKCALAVSHFAGPEIDRVTKRRPSLSSLKFPYGNIRTGQSEFIRTGYRVLSRGGVLFASAPTGTGKTVSALYPALKALGNGRFEKIFYLTPKGTTALAVRECVELMAEGGAEIRAVILSSKERCCINGNACRESRRLCKASGLNNISEGALRLYALEKTVVSVDDVQRVAREYGVCPYELSLTYAELCDLVICDINYLFNPTVYIRRFFDAPGPYAFLIDEAHNLGERVREAYSAQLSAEDISLPNITGLLGDFSELKTLSADTAGRFREILMPLVKEEIRELPDGKRVGATHLSELPLELYELFSELISKAERELFISYSAKDNEAGARIKFLREYLQNIKQFSSVLWGFDSGYEAFVFFEDGKTRIKLFCLDTGKIIKKRLALGHGAILFSATLTPLHYYRETLGGERSDEILEVGSPFDASQLSVSIMDKISTRLSERDRTLSAVVRTIAAAVSARRGNYMVFSPSFAYSEALSRAFRAKYPKLRVIVETRGMTEADKENFLLEFKKEDESYLVAFCVMGGIYSEGIDLAGESLIGAIIVGIGIPSLSYEREAIAAYYEEKYESGKEYAYIYPGMNRVFQAAGRVIRREDDRGIIVLIDDRFDDPIYKKSLPGLWEGVKFIDTPRQLKEEVEAFWKETDNQPK